MMGESATLFAGFIMGTLFAIGGVVLRELLRIKGERLDAIEGRQVGAEASVKDLARLHVGVDGWCRKLEERTYALDRDVEALANRAGVKRYGTPS
jgi:hypothetical protein